MCAVIAYRSVTCKPVGFLVVCGCMFSFTCTSSDWHMVQKQSLKGEDSGCRTMRPFPSLPLFWLVFLQVSVMGIFRTKWSTWRAYLHVNFQNASPTFHRAIVMLLYLFCLGTNREEGSKWVSTVSWHFFWLSLCPTGWKPACYLFLAPQILGSRAELGGLLSSLGFSASRHLTMGTFLPWVTGLVQVTVVRV